MAVTVTGRLEDLKMRTDRMMGTGEQEVSSNRRDRHPKTHRETGKGDDKRCEMVWASVGALTGLWSVTMRRLETDSGDETREESGALQVNRL